MVRVRIDEIKEYAKTNNVPIMHNRIYKKK